MDWTTALEALGGGAPAIMVIGLAWACWRLWNRNEELIALLMDRKDDEIRASERREIAVQTSIEAVTVFIKDYARSK